MSAPTSKQWIYNPYEDLQWGGVTMVPFIDVKQAAIAQGFGFTRPCSVPVDNKVYDVHSGLPIGNWNDFPDTDPAPVEAEVDEPASEADAEKSLLQTVLDYLASPERSERGIVIQKLNDAGFFSADNDDARRAAVNTVLADYAEDCPSGAERARLALGNHLTQNNKLVRITVDVVVEDPTNSIGYGQSDYSVTYDFINVVNSALNGRLGNWTLAKPIAYTEYIAQPDKEQS